ncbi:MAG: hypothetical protein ACI857_001434 [Arenicella sp.]|jgi:hypothetical protein
MKKLLLFSALLCGTTLFSQTVVLAPEKDNAMYSESNNSSGAGQIYSGRNNTGDPRRALLQFDIAGSIPSGATITSVSLDLNIDQSPSFAAVGIFDLHPVTSDWGEGTSVGSGVGAAPVAPDATWSDAMFGTSTWTTAGGDFGASSAATNTSIATGTFTWTSAQMATDVQNWLTTPATNFGWILIGDESVNKSARRFGSKEIGVAPQLTVNYTCTTPPTAVCQNINAYLDGAGNAVINDADLDGGSAPVCATSLTFSASQTAFTCGDILSPPSEDLVLSAIYDGPLTGGLPKGVEVYVINDIPDLSEYGIGSATNGGGTDGEEFTFPAVTVTAGTYLYIASEAPMFTTWFGFAPDYTDNDLGVNGDDAVELFHNGSVIDIYGDINLIGDGEPWDYTDGWAYRNNSTGPDGSTFQVGNWTYSGINVLDGESDNGSAATPIPVGTFTSGLVPGPTPVILTVTDDNAGVNTCIAMVSVLDTLPPVMDCVGAMTIVLNSTGDTTLLATDLDNGTADICGLDTLYLSTYDFTCAEDGLNQVTLYAEDDYGNIDSCTVDITIDAGSTITVVTDSVHDVSCFGLDDGGVYITTTGGNGTITYDWDNDVNGDFDDVEDLTPIGSGAWTLVVLDASGCTATTNGTVNEPAAITYTLDSTNTSCGLTNDAAIDLTISGGTGTLLFDWNNDATGDFDDTEDLAALIAGVYTIVAMDDNGCSITDSIEVMESMLPDVTVTMPVWCTYIVGEPNATYQWINCNDSTDIAGATDSTLDLSSGLPINSDEAAVIVTSASGCTDTSACVPVTFVGINEIDGRTVSMFPNPVSSELLISIEGNTELIKINVLDINGRLVYMTSTSNVISSIDMSAFENGVYLVEFATELSSLTQRIVVRH